MSQEDKKVVRNVVIIIMFALPCVLLFCNELFLKFLGVVYTIGYWDNILKPVQRRYKEFIGNKE